MTQSESPSRTQRNRWRNRAEFVVGTREIVALLTRKWNRELDYRLIKELRAFHENRIARPDDHPGLNDLKL